MPKVKYYYMPGSNPNSGYPSAAILQEWVRVRAEPEAIQVLTPEDKEEEFSGLAIMVCTQGEKCFSLIRDMGATDTTTLVITPFRETESLRSLQSGSQIIDFRELQQAGSDAPVALTTNLLALQEHFYKRHAISGDPKDPLVLPLEKEVRATDLFFQMQLNNRAWLNGSDQCSKELMLADISLWVEFLKERSADGDFHSQRSLRIDLKESDSPYYLDPLLEDILEQQKKFIDEHTQTKEWENDPAVKRKVQLIVQFQYAVTDFLLQPAWLKRNRSLDELRQMVVNFNLLFSRKIDFLSAEEKSVPFLPVEELNDDYVLPEEMKADLLFVDLSSSRLELMMGEVLEPYRNDDRLPVLDDPNDDRDDPNDDRDDPNDDRDDPNDDRLPVLNDPEDTMPLDDPDKLSNFESDTELEEKEEEEEEEKQAQEKESDTTTNTQQAGEDELATNHSDRKLDDLVTPVTPVILQPVFSQIVDPDDTVASAHLAPASKTLQPPSRPGWLRRFPTQYPIIWGLFKWLAIGAALATIIYFSGGLATIPILAKLGAVVIPAAMPVLATVSAACWYGIVKPIARRCGFFRASKPEQLRTGMTKKIKRIKSFHLKITPPSRQSELDVNQIEKAVFAPLLKSASFDDAEVKPNGFRAVFAEGQGAAHFKTQLEALRQATQEVKAPFACFIVNDTTAANPPNYVVGLLTENKLLIINPKGGRPSDEFHSQLQETAHVNQLELIFSATKIQKDSQAITIDQSGPICVELLRHLVSLPGPGRQLNITPRQGDDHMIDLHKAGFLPNSLSLMSKAQVHEAKDTSYDTSLASICSTNTSLVKQIAMQDPQSVHYDEKNVMNNVLHGVRDRFSSPSYERLHAQYAPRRSTSSFHKSANDHAMPPGPAAPAATHSTHSSTSHSAPPPPSPKGTDRGGTPL